MIRDGTGLQTLFMVKARKEQRATLGEKHRVKGTAALGLMHGPGYALSRDAPAMWVR